MGSLVAAVVMPTQPRNGERLDFPSLAYGTLEIMLNFTRNTRTHSKIVAINVMGYGVPSRYRHIYGRTANQPLHLHLSAQLL